MMTEPKLPMLQFSRQTCSSHVILETLLSTSREISSDKCGEKMLMARKLYEPDRIIFSFLSAQNT